MAGNKHGVFTGARAILSFGGGDIIGFATNVSGSEDVEYVPINVLNNVQVREFVPVGYNVSFSASRVYIFAEALKRKNVFPKTSGNSVAHLTNILNVGGDDGLTVQIVDSQGGGETFMILEGASISSRSWSFGARDVVGEDVTFVAVRMFDQTDSGTAGAGIV